VEGSSSSLICGSSYPFALQLVKIKIYRSRMRAVGIATGYGMDGVRVPVRARIFLLHIV
jgi:hypothetical protein